MPTWNEIKSVWFYVFVCVCAPCICLAALSFAMDVVHDDTSRLLPLLVPSLMSEFCIIYLCWYTTATYHRRRYHFQWRWRLRTARTYIWYTKRSCHFRSRASKFRATPSTPSSIHHRLRTSTLARTHLMPIRMKCVPTDCIRYKKKRRREYCI